MKASYILNIASYIAHPYTIELEKVINIEKSSGMNRARSEGNRAKALSEYLTKNGMTNDEYVALKILAERPFYINGSKEIVIPENQIYGMLAQASDEARAATRVASKDQIRTTLRVLGPVHTGKTKADGVYERFATPTTGTGAKLSNQRALRSNPYIADFRARLDLEFDDAHVDPKRVRQFLEFCGREVGIGASRKMGYGRFTIEPAPSSTSMSTASAMSTPSTTSPPTSLLSAPPAPASKPTTMPAATSSTTPAPPPSPSSASTPTATAPLSASPTSPI